MGQWCNLPVDLLGVIEDHLVLYIDEVRIRSVCLGWNSYLPKLPNHQVKQIPWLLHPLDNNTDGTHGLFNPIDNKVYEIYLPEAQGKIFKGSSYGWVVTVEDIHSSSPTDIYLINPLTRDRITLPPRTEFADVVEYSPNEVDEEFVVLFYYDDSTRILHDTDFDPDTNEITLSSYFTCVSCTMKVVLSSAPCDECVVVAIYGQANYLAWCRCHGKKWTHYSGITGVLDIIFDEGKLYALNLYGEIFVLENIGSGLDSKVTKIASGVPIPRGRGVYLAVCFDGSLLVVSRYYDLDRKKIEGYHVRTIGFKVYKLDSSNSALIEVKNIDGDILFLGSFSSARLISSHDLQGLSGYKGNCIYFSDSNRLSDSAEVNKNSDVDIGVFNLEDGTLELWCGLHQPIWPRPIWINVD